MNTNDIAIGIISYERGDRTNSCIESIRENTRIPHKIFLIDNGSCQNETKCFFSSWKNSEDIKFISLDKNFGPSYARNIVIEMVKDRYHVIVFLDNDTLALEGWDYGAIKALEDGADLIQPKLLHRDLKTVERGPTIVNPNPLSAWPGAIANNAPRMHENAVNKLEVPVVGGTGIFNSGVFQQIGGFDERLFIAEDLDISFRAKNAGYKLVYEPSCELVHDHGFSYNYEVERSSLEKYLSAHVIFWNKHQKALLSPAYLRWYSWLYRHNEPMYLPENEKWSIVHRRLRRRLAKFIIMRNYGNNWDDKTTLEGLSEQLAKDIGM